MGSGGWGAPGRPQTHGPIGAPMTPHASVTREAASTSIGYSFFSAGRRKCNVERPCEPVRDTVHECIHAGSRRLHGLPWQILAGDTAGEKYVALEPT